MCVSTAFVAKTLPLSCASTALQAKTLPLPCMFPLPSWLRQHLSLRSSGQDDHTPLLIGERMRRAAAAMAAQLSATLWPDQDRLSLRCGALSLPFLDLSLPFHCLFTAFP